MPVKLVCVFVDKTERININSYLNWMDLSVLFFNLFNINKQPILYEILIIDCIDKLERIFIHTLCWIRWWYIQYRLWKTIGNHKSFERWCQSYIYIINIYIYTTRRFDEWMFLSWTNFWFPKLIALYDDVVGPFLLQLTRLSL